MLKALPAECSSVFVWIVSEPDNNMNGSIQKPYSRIENSYQIQVEIQVNWTPLAIFKTIIHSN